MGKEGERETVAGHNTAVVDERWRGVISILIGTVCPSAAIQVTPQRSGSRLRPILPNGQCPRLQRRPKEGCARTAWAGRPARRQARAGGPTGSKKN